MSMTVELTAASALGPAPSFDLLPAPLPADASEAARFAALMGPAASPQPTGGAAGVSGVAGVSSAASVSGGTGGGSVGDAILRGLTAAGQDYARTADEARELILKPGSDFSLRDLLTIQFQMIDASLHAELIGKAISKTVQHVDQLTKLQ